jgi:hypothetical protein
MRVSKWLDVAASRWTSGVPFAARESGDAVVADSFQEDETSTYNG